MNIQELQPSHTFYPKILAPFSLTAEAFFQPFMLFFFFLERNISVVTYTQKKKPKMERIFFTLKLNKTFLIYFAT